MGIGLLTMKIERLLGMKRLILFFMVTLWPICLIAQTPGTTPVGGKKRPALGLPKTFPAPSVRVPFNIFDFFKTFNPQADVDDDDAKAASLAKDGFQKLEQLGIRRDDLLKGAPAQILKRGPFEFAYFETMAYIIDPQYPTQAVTMEGPFFGLYSKENIHYQFANEVAGIEVEKIGPSKYRIFIQSVGGDIKFSRSPITTVGDYDSQNQTFTTYDFPGLFFAMDVEKKGNRDLVLYDEGYRDKAVEWGILGASVLSWDGKEWTNISQKEKGFIQKLMKIGY